MGVPTVPRDGIFELNLENITEWNEVFNLVSEETVGIYWGFTPLPHNIKLAPFHDLIYVTRNDTSSFTISF